MVDPREGKILACLFPLDRRANADGQRALVNPLPGDVSAIDPPPAQAELPPLLKQILADYSATGLPPAYLPKDSSGDKQEKGDIQ
jgi:putative transposase